jgi:hypothetical protein
MSPVPLSWYGSADLPPARRLLRAGPLTLEYEAGDLRYVRLGDREVIRRWYSAVRDANWGTVPVRLIEERFDVGPDRFQVEYRAENRQGGVDFAWTGSITGSTEGTIAFRMEGEARSTFQRNRLGFCLLHPVRECAGARCRFVLGDGTSAEGAFPVAIAHENPFKELRTFAHEVSPGVWAELRFEGDLFEMEDQRNWTDASFKTFCTPLRIPFPVTVAAGSRIRQTVTLALTGASGRSPGPGTSAPRLRVVPSARPVPGIGLGMRSDDRPLDPRELDRLRSARPSHLRVDLDLAEAGLAERLHRAAETARALHSSLEAALLVSGRAAEELLEFGGLLRELRPPVLRWLVFHRDEWSTTAPWIRLAREALAPYDPAIPLFSGSRANFFELNGGRPASSLVDGLCYAAHPQEHAFDNASLVETCATLQDTVESARGFSGGLPVAVTPVTFRKRLNPYATAPSARQVSPASRIDPRQGSLFGAGWTLGCLKYLAESGAAGITFFETAGPLGVAEGERVFPLYHVLADVAELAPGEVLAAAPDQPLRLNGMALRSRASTRILVANHSAEPTAAEIHGVSGTGRVRVLDESTFEQATSRPEQFRSHPGEERAACGGRLELSLPPYAYARIDVDG